MINYLSLMVLYGPFTQTFLDLVQELDLPDEQSRPARIVIESLEHFAPGMCPTAKEHQPLFCSEGFVDLVALSLDIETVTV